MMHPPVETLIQYALGIAAPRSDAEHIMGCSICSDEVEELVDSRPGRPLEIPDQLVAMHGRIDDERQAAAERLQQIDDSSLDEALRSEHVFRTEGGFRSVIDAVFAIRSRDPKVGLRVTEALLEVAEQLGDMDSRKQARAEALREAAVSQRVLGNYDEALELLDRAEHAAAELVVSEFLLARVWYERASVEITREGDEARAWAEKAAEVYHRFGDRRRWNRARFLVVMSHFNERHFDGVIEAARALLPHVEAEGDVETHAACWSLIGQALTKKDLLDEASEAFSRAIELFDELDLPVERLRAQWAKAKADILLGEHRHTRVELERIRDRFRSFGLLEETSLAGLDLTECLILEGETDRAQTICRESLRALQTFFSGREQQRALAYLSELSANLAAHEVRYVSGFLFDSLADPESIFQPHGR